MNKAIVGICTLIELGCIGALAFIGLKRNNDAYIAEIKRIAAEGELFLEKMNVENKDYEIKQLKKELEYLKSQEES